MCLIFALKKKVFLEQREKERNFTSFLSLLSDEKNRAHKDNKKAHTKEDSREREKREKN